MVIVMLLLLAIAACALGKQITFHIKTKHDTDTDLTQVPTRPYNCTHCDYITKRKHDLKSHVMKKHSDVQLSFPCNVRCVENFLVIKVT